jgi:thiosulfate/3-mercaptopyruvate sulfurtransferase
MAGFGPLVEGRWLLDNLDRPDLRVIDFRWYLDGRSGQDAYRAGHIPGAVFVDLDREVTGKTGGGRHPLPDREAFERAMRAAGVAEDSRVVVYDDQGGFSAARLWFLLRYFGHPSASVLDGGLAAWPGDMSTEEVRPPAGDFRAAPPRENMKVDYEDLRRPLDRVTILDARSPERYRGEVEPLDPQAGHIPGARNAPWQGNLDGSQRYLSPAQLRQRFTELGVRDGADVVAYCGSGVSACQNLLALEVAGFPGARLYPGSWSEWSRKADAPVATGND